MEELYTVYCRDPLLCLPICSLNEDSYCSDMTPKVTHELLGLDSLVSGSVSGQGSCQPPSLPNGLLSVHTGSWSTGPFPGEAARQWLLCRTHFLG